MFASVRHYVLTPGIVDDLVGRAAEADAPLAGIPGWSSAQLIRTRDGLIVVIIGDAESALVEAGRRFAAWARRCVPALRDATGPDVWFGDLVWSTPQRPEPIPADGPVR
jgi:hypothetical protein